MSRSRFLTTAQIGPRRSLTPEGFLVCHDVAIARIGIQKYMQGETPVAARDGITIIHREPNDVFRDETMRSFEGKPVTNDHPTEDVTPENWKRLAIGTIHNVRRESDLLMADLVINDSYGISLVKSGKVEVSCGYDADYEEIAPGEGRQVNIIGNHLALVDRGRCGPRCSIGDSAPEQNSMAKKFKDYLQRAFKAKDSAELEAIEKEMKDADIGELSEPSPAVHVHIGSSPQPAGTESTLDNEESEMGKFAKEVRDGMKSIGDRLEALEGKKANDAEAEEAERARKAAEDKKARDEEAERIRKEADDKKNKDGDYTETEMQDEMPEGEEAGKQKDSAKFKDSFDAALAGAEILAPGKISGTLDSAAPPKAGMKAIHEVRLAAIEHASRMPGTDVIVVAALGGRAFDRARISVRDTATVFRSLVAARAQLNNAAQVANPSLPAKGVIAGPQNLAELNQMFQKHQW